MLEGICPRCGAPIFNHNSKVVAGLSIAGPASRIKEENIEFLAKLVTETAALISNGLGSLRGGVVEPSAKASKIEEKKEETE